MITYINSELTVKEFDEKGEFNGFASTFGGAPDMQNDIVAKGAFAETLRRDGAPAMLWSHRLDEPIGVWKSLRETDAGLEVDGKLTLAVARARETHALMMDGAVRGLSVGIRIEDADRKNGARVIKKAKLVEISLTPLPANPNAQIVAVKSALQRGEIPTIREFEGYLRDVGWSRSQAAAIASRGYKAIERRDDVAAIEQLTQTIKGFCHG